MATKSATKKVVLPSITDNDVIDLVTKILYSDTTKELFFEEDILKKTNLNYTTSDANRVWELLLASNMVIQSIGFGNAGKLELSSNGLGIMNKYGGYLDYLQQTQTAAPSVAAAVPLKDLTPVKVNEKKGNSETSRNTNKAKKKVVKKVAQKKK